MLFTKQKLLAAKRKARQNNGGYTLQTVIVISILVATAVGASAVLYRTINSNTNVRSITDLAGFNAPSRPHGFSVERTTELVDMGESTERTVPSATIRWSPPLYTGQPQLEGTPASLLYKVDYGCADPANSTDINNLGDITLANIPDLETNDPTDMASTTDIDESRLDPDGTQTHYGDSTELSFPDDENTEHSIPERILRVLFPNPTSLITPPETVYCILQAQAYTCSDAQTEDCANPGDNASRTDDPLTGQEIYSLESEQIRFELNRAPSAIQVPEATAQYRSATPPTESRVDLSWDTPAYTGAGQAYLYEIQWQQREPDDDETDFDASGFTPAGTQCTVGNTHSLVLTLNTDSDADNESAVDFRITPYAVTATEAAVAVPTAFACPASPTSAVAGSSSDIFGVELIETQPVATPPPSLTLSIPTSENIASTATDAQKRTALNNLYVDVQAAAAVALPVTRPYSLESYELRWSRADGESTANTRVIPAPTSGTADPSDATREIFTATATLNLENDKAYDFSLTANFSNDETGRISTEQISRCAVISHSQRTPAPDLEVIPISTGLRVRIAPHNQASFCDGPVTALSAPATQDYKVRVYDPASSCTGDYPNEQCSDAYNQCVAATTGSTRPSAEEVLVTGLTAGTNYETEVIAGHGCDATAKTISFTIPSPNYGYPSAAIVKSATPLAASTAIADPTAPTVTYDSITTEWTVEWAEVSGAIGYLFILDHDSASSTDATRYAYVPASVPASSVRSSRTTSFSAPAPINSFTCSKTSTTISCETPDDGDTSTDLKVTVQAVGSSGISNAAETTTAQS